ncbi:MAG: glucose-6-phosphate dehydrogenase, partial [Dehalococcoidia bacterium]
MAKGSTSIIIFGATGDLTQRKLLPALFNLRCKGHLPANTNILGFSRTPYSDEEFRRVMRKGTQEFGDLAVHEDEWDAFAQDLYYISGDLGKPEDFIRLGQRLDELEGDAY